MCEDQIHRKLRNPRDMKLAPSSSLDSLKVSFIKLLLDFEMCNSGSLNSSLTMMN